MVPWSAYLPLPETTEIDRSLARWLAALVPGVGANGDCGKEEIDDLEHL